MCLYLKKSPLLWLLGHAAHNLEHDSIRDGHSLKCQPGLHILHLFRYEIPVSSFFTSKLYSILISTLLTDRIYGSHDKTINVWQFNPGYTESGDARTTSLKVENVVNFDKLIKYHKSGVTCLTYDGINCIVSANTQGSVLLIDINGILLRQLNFTSHFEPITSMKVN